MGKLYDNNKIIGYYHGSYVTVNYSDTKEIAKYDRGLITVNGHYVATCDENGYIYSEQNRAVALARCKDGCVHDLNRSGYNVIAYYDGDMYGAAAAVATLILNLGVKSNVSTSDNSSVQTNSSSPSHESSSSLSGGDSASSDDFDFLKFIIAVLLFIPMLVISIIKFILTSPKFTMFAVTFCMATTICIRIIYGYHAFVLLTVVWMIFLIISFCAASMLYTNRKKQVINNKTAIVLNILQNVTWLITMLTHIWSAGRSIIVRDYPDSGIFDIMRAFIDLIPTRGMNAYFIWSISMSLSINMSLIVLLVMIFSKRKYNKQEKLQAKNNNT